MALDLPNPNQRFRCTRCGNLTRFDVVKTSTTKEFWHQNISGEVAIEDTEVQDLKVVSVVCRWCSATDEVEIVDRLETD
jgi:hypothetical protein